MDGRGNPRARWRMAGGLLAGTNLQRTRSKAGQELPANLPDAAVRRPSERAHTRSVERKNQPERSGRLDCLVSALCFAEVFY